MMWLLSILPDSIFYTAAVVGILAFVATIILNQVPLISTYSLPISIVSVILVAFGFYFSGGISVKDVQEKRIAELQNKILVVEKQSAELNGLLMEEINKNKQLVKDRQNEITKQLKDVAKKDDVNCTFSNATILLYNRATQNGVSESSGELPTGTSDVKASELLGNASENYETYYKLVQDVKGWQKWYKEQKELFESVK